MEILNYIGEEWKDIKGYEGLYQVSNLGRVRSLYFNKTKIINQRIRGKGYCAVSLSKNGKQKTYYVHRLVAEAFIPNPDNLPQVNHKSEVKTDNRVENLEWCDNLYNINYGTRTTRSNSVKRNYNGRRNGNHNGKAVYQYTMDNRFVKQWSSVKEIQKELGFYYKCISKCCRGIYKQSYDYKWYYNKLGE